MNEFQSISSGSGLLKDSYDKSPSNAMKSAIINRKRKLISEGSASPDDDYNSKDPEKEKSDE